MIQPGSVPRLRGAQVRAHYAVGQLLGVPALTQKEVAVLITQAGDFPVIARRKGKRQAQFEEKVAHLALLDEQGRIRRDLVPALAEVDHTMAIIQACLRDLPWLEAKAASSVVRARREVLREQVPQIATNDWEARLAWTARYDMLLDAAAEERQDWALMPPWARGTMFVLARYSIVERGWDGDAPAFRLTPAGQSRRLAGRQEVDEIRASIPQLLAQVVSGEPSPEVTLGRLHSAGVRVQGSHLEFRRLGRIEEGGEALRATGISDSTQAILDMKWWQAYWQQRSALPMILQRVVLRPEELPPEWSPGQRGGQRAEFVPPLAAERSIHTGTSTDRDEDRHVKKQILRQPTHSITHPGLPEPSKGETRDRKR